MTETDKLKDFIVKKLDSKLAENIKVLDLSEKTNIAHYMIFCDGQSFKHVSSLAEFISMEIRDEFDLNVGLEGLNSNSGWSVIDTGDIMVHIFHPETREQFKLQEHWEKK